MRPLPTLLTLALAAAFGGFVASAINAHLDNRAEAAPATLAIPATAALPASVAGQPVPSLAPMLERVMPAVVSVNTKQVVRVRNPYFNDPFFRRLFPEVPQERINESLGSGVIIDAAEGLVLTNHHVIENADDVQVTLSATRTSSRPTLRSTRATPAARWSTCRASWWASIPPASTRRAAWPATSGWAWPFRPTWRAMWWTS